MEFVDWLNTEVEKRGWTFNELARQAGLSSGAVSLVLSSQRGAGPEFCNGIARALHVPAERVFRLAGLLPARIIGEDNEEQKRELIDYFDALGTNDRQTVVTLTRALYEQHPEYNTKEDTDE